MKNLVIVESPAKIKRIETYLGSDYKVMSSKGHVCDLPDKSLSIDINNHFKPTYVVSEDKKKLVAELKKAAKNADMVWLASDDDREGEAIAWHLFNELQLDPAKTRRMVFHEITKPALLEAIQHPREINMNLVNAQQARRVLDRLVGYELSPVLWKKIKPGLSAGRVQSVTARLVVEREREIQNFQATPSFRVTAVFAARDAQGQPCELQAELKRRFATKDEARQFLEMCQKAQFRIESIEKHPAKQFPAAPFTTSTLQQEASRKLGFSVSQTMRIAQKLYESGQITYMRTDSLNLSSLAVNTIKQEIVTNIGENYLKVRQYHTKSKGAQEAHEAIRPTYISNRTIAGTAQEQRLYELIWKRTIASQMADAEFERTTVTIVIDGSNEQFVVEGKVLTFDGFLRVYIEAQDDDSEQEQTTRLPALTQQTLTLKTAMAQERFAQKPSRYTEGTLVKKMEEVGIGRPATYNSFVSTILAREYVDKREIVNKPREYTVLTLDNNGIRDEVRKEKPSVEKGKLSPTDIGIVVNDFLTKYFSKIMDYNFTANVEEEFDDVAAGKIAWNQNIGNFYEPFHKEVLAADQAVGTKPGEHYLGDDPKTGKPVYAKISRFGVVAQLGSSDSDEKPRFADLQPGQSIFTITLDEALELFKLPRNIGQFEGEDLIVADGRFGPYIKHGKAFYSVPKTDNPLTLNLERALEIIETKREADKNKVIHTFGDIQVLNGRYGAYIHTVSDKKNYKLPKGTDAATLTEEDCKAIIANPENASKGRTAYRAARKTTAKKTK
ncbi:MAG: type I DNA topoisomerase [Paludibacteraceae bacterium]